MQKAFFKQEKYTVKDFIIVHIFYYFLIWTSIVVPLAVFSEVYARDRNRWKIGAIVYALLLLGIWKLTKAQVVTIVSFILPITWIFNNILFLKGTKSFKVSLAFASYVISICIESITATVLAILSILFPKAHIISVNIGRFGNTLTIVLVSSIEMVFILIVYHFIKKFLVQLSYMVNAKLIIRVAIPMVIIIMLSNISGVVPPIWSIIVIHLVVALLSAWIAWKLYCRGLIIIGEQERKHIDEIYKMETLDAEIQYLHRMDREYRRLRHWDHDMKNHLTAISHLISQRKYEDAEKYMKELTEDFERLTKDEGAKSNGIIFKKI